MVVNRPITAANRRPIARRECIFGGCDGEAKGIIRGGISAALSAIRRTGESSCKIGWTDSSVQLWRRNLTSSLNLGCPPCRHDHVTEFSAPHHDMRDRYIVRVLDALVSCAIRLIREVGTGRIGLALAVRWGTSSDGIST